MVPTTESPGLLQKYIPKPLQCELLLPPESYVFPSIYYHSPQFSHVFDPVPRQLPTKNDSSNPVPGDAIESRPFADHTQLRLFVKRLRKLNLLEPTKKADSIGVEDFEVLKLVGQGGFGKVYQVRKRDTSEIYAMKVMKKDRLLKKSQDGYAKTEREVLTKVDHPFIVKLKYSFQTKYRLYLVMDFLNGGQLFFHVGNHGFFMEDLARVYAAEIVSAVSYLHANGIMHRDIKSDNILLDADGHAMLTDFSLAKQFDHNTRSTSYCGTRDYMSPEILLGKGHDQTTDWWSVGILIYEMLTGKNPFTGNRKKLKLKIVNDKIKLPSFLSSEAHSLLKGLLQKDPSNRLGSGPTGSEDIKRHKWFKPIDWKKLEAREIEPSFRPKVAGKHCIANFDEEWTDKPLLDSPASSPNTIIINPFKDFTYVRPAACVLEKE